MNPTIELTQEELENIARVKKGIADDREKGPWRSDKWYKKFSQDNEDGFSLKEAPLNEPLMVVTESLGTLISYNRGQSVMRGSLLMKVSDEEVYCFDAQSWYASETRGAIDFENNGYFTLSSSSLYGKVKLIKDLIL